MSESQAYYYQGDYGCDPQYGSTASLPAGPSSLLSTAPLSVPPAYKEIEPGEYGVWQGQPVATGFDAAAFGAGMQIAYVAAYVESVAIGLMGIGEQALGITIPQYHETIE